MDDAGKGFAGLSSMVSDLEVEDRRTARRPCSAKARTVVAEMANRLKGAGRRLVLNGERGYVQTSGAVFLSYTALEFWYLGRCQEADRNEAGLYPGLSIRQ